MKTITAWIMFAVVALFAGTLIYSCSASQASEKGMDSPKKDTKINEPVKDTTVVATELNEMIDNHPDNMDMRTFNRYNLMIFQPITMFHWVNGRMPQNLDEFWASDLCLVHPKEIVTNLPFASGDAISEEHPEVMVYRLIDEDAAELSILLTDRDGGKYIHKHTWNPDKFLSFIPRDMEGKDAAKYAEMREAGLGPRLKANKAMLDLFMNLWYHAVADYYGDHQGYPANIAQLFAEKWGAFRSDPWDNYSYDNTDEKIPQKTFGFDKEQNVMVVISTWQYGNNTYAIRLPANFIEEPTHPLNMSEVPAEEIGTLELEIFTDVDLLMAM